MLGGLSKKTTYLNEYRKNHKNLIIVDSGDLLNEHYDIKDSFMASARLKADLVASVSSDLKIDAINVGELELVLGLDYIKELEKKYKLPFISSNIVDGNGKLIFNPYVIKEMDGIKVGIIGLMGDTTDMTSLLDGIAGTTYKVLNPLDTAQSLVDELKGKVDLIIAMTHQHMGRNWVVARKIDGIDVVVGGHHKQRLDNPYNANNTYIVQSGEKGQYQGMLEVTLASDGTVTAENSMIPLSEEVVDDPEVRARVDRFNNRVNELYAAGIKTEKEPVPLKTQVCQDCHGDAWEVWTKSDHAKAFATLENKSREHNPDCLACHTTRFEQPGGFNMELQQEELRNIQCDSCHGDSSMHLEDPGTVPAGDPGMETCLKCHTEHRCPDFERDYQKEWEKIKH